MIRVTKRFYRTVERLSALLSFGISITKRCIEVFQWQFCVLCRVRSLPSKNAILTPCEAYTEGVVRVVGSGKAGNADNETRSTSPSRFMPRPFVRLGDDIHLEPREMPAVNPLVVTLDSQSAYDTVDVRVLQEVQEVRARLDTLAPGQAQSDAVLRGELAEALQLTAGLTPFAANDLLFGQPIETITIQPTLRLNPQPGGWNYDVGGTNLRNPVQVLQNNQLIGTIPVGADTGARFSLQSGQYNIVLRDAVTYETLGTAVLKTYGSSINVLSKNIPQPAAYQQTKPLVATTSVPVARAELDALFADLSEVWTPSASTILTQAELIAARTRLLAGTANDETAMKNALLAQPGVEAVVTPTLAFQVAYNNNGGRVLIVDGANLPEGSRLVFSSDAGLLNVLDERSFLPGSNHAEVAVGAASYVGLVDASGDLLGQSFSLSVESGYLMVRRGQTVVGMTGNTFDPAAIPGVFVPLTKDSLTAVSPQARLIVSGQSADLRFEWLPAGAVIEGLTDTPIVTAGGALNVPIFVANGTQRAVTVRAADGTELMDRHMVGSNGQGGFIFYRPTSGQTQFITSREFGPAALATREQTRAVQVGRTVSTRLNPVFPSGSTEVTRAWGLMVAGLAGVDLAQTRSQIARQHSALVALWEDDREGFYAEVNRRYEETPIQSGRKIETAGMIESRMKGEVFDAYARADQAIQDALPVLGDLTLAAYLNVQATRTDTSTPPNLAQVRNYTAQARNAAPLLPSDQQLLTAIGAHFDTIRSYLAGETTNWRNEINEASIAGRISSNPNPGGGELPRSQELIAYETALSAVSEAERQLRLASAAGEPRRLSAAKVTLVTAQAKLVTAEAAYRLWQKEQADKSDVKPVSLDGEQILTVSKSALERLLASLPGKILNVEARLQTTTDQRLRQDLVAERAHWLALQEAATGLLALVPANGTYPTIVGTQAQGWARYLSDSITSGQVETFTVEGIGGNDENLPIEAASLLARSFPNGSEPTEARAAAIVLAQYGTRRQLEAEMLGWKVVSQSPALPLLADVRQDTYAGRLLVVGFTHLWSQRDYIQGQWDVAFRLQILTDIPAAKLVAIASMSTVSQATSAFKNLLPEAQYGHLLESSTSLPLVAAADKPNGYAWGDREIRIRFDLQGVSSIRAANVYVDGTLVDQSGAASFIRMSISSLPVLTLVGPANSTSAEDVYVLRLDVVLASGVRQSVDVEVYIPAGWVEELRRRESAFNPGDYSTLPEGQLRTIENEIFSTLALPVAGGGWVSKFGSEAHDGQDLYAIDLSKDEDTGTSIHMPTAGVIESVNLDDGRVVIRHTTASGATWYSQFEHMTHILEAVTGISYVSKKDAALLPAEERLAADQARAAAQAAINAYIARSEVVGQDVQIGRLGNEGSYTTGSHLHFSVYHADRQTPVNLYHWLNAQQPGIVHLAQVGGKTVDLSFTWDDTAVALVNAAERIALRSVDVPDDASDSSDHIKPERWAYAWEDGKTLEQMTRVVWKTLPFMNDNGVMDTNGIWVDATNDDRRWSASKQKFVDRLTGAEL